MDRYIDLASAFFFPPLFTFSLFSKFLTAELKTEDQQGNTLWCLVFFVHYVKTMSFHTCHFRLAGTKVEFNKVFSSAQVTLMF